jgi:CRP/FNR family cyclic AMP-dependent transcriptional regulator
MAPSARTDLSDIWLFSGCSKAERKAVENHATEVDAPAGHVIVDEGSVGTAFYVILEGKVAVLRRGRKIAELDAGQIFGEISLLDRLPRNASVKAITDTRLACFSQKDFDSVLKESPATTRKLLTAMAVRLRESDARAQY